MVVLHLLWESEFCSGSVWFLLPATLHDVGFARSWESASRRGRLGVHGNSGRGSHRLVGGRVVIVQASSVQGSIAADGESMIAGRAAKGGQGGDGQGREQWHTHP